MSGHNKWSKIKHKKAATDAEKSKIFSKYATLIAMESRKCAGNLTSPNLLAVIERAKKDSMPKDNIERAVAKGAGTTGVTFQEILYEAFGPGGVAMVITVITDNNNRTNQEIKNIFSKAGLSLGGPGSASWAFTKTNREYIPTTLIKLNETDNKALSTLLEKLECNDDIQAIFTSAETE